MYELVRFLKFRQRDKKKEKNANRFVFHGFQLSFQSARYKFIHLYIYTFTMTFVPFWRYLFTKRVFLIHLLPVICSQFDE